MPTTDRPTIAITTVSPANTTALPAVPTASAADSDGSTPWESWDRCRVTMNSA